MCLIQVKEKMFELDWSRLMGKDNVLRMLKDEVADVRQQMFEHHDLIYNVFFSFAVSQQGGGPTGGGGHARRILNCIRIPLQ